MTEIDHVDDHHLENTTKNRSDYTIQLNSPEWISIRIALILSVFIEVIFTAVLVDILYRKKLISGVVLRIVGSLTSGLMLSGGLVHIFAEALEHYAETTDHPNYNIPTIICAVTILFLIVIDKVIHIVMKIRNESIKHKKVIKKGYKMSIPIASNNDQVREPNENIELEEVKLNSNLNCELEVVGNESKIPKENTTEPNHSEGHFDITLVVDKWYVAVILLLAVGLHSLFAGLGFGTTRSVTIMFQVYAFIVMHKGLVAASLAFVMLQYSAYFTRCRYYLLMLTFSFMTPIGASIGIGLSHIDARYELIEVVFNCISAGTFIYLAIKELVVLFFDSEEKKYWIDLAKILAYIIGFAFLSGLAIWHPHEAIEEHNH